jgi:molybdopterin synthase catalytic subunit
MPVQMRVNVLYFAILRERLGIDGESLDLPVGADVRAARAEIAARHPDIAALLSRVATAVNQSMAPEAHPLADGDELALIPPVAGGENDASRGEAGGGRGACPPPSRGR